MESRVGRILYINEALTGFGPGPAAHGAAIVRELRALGANVTIFPPVQKGSEGRARPAGAFSRLRRYLRTRLPGTLLDFGSGFLRTATRCWQIWIRRHQLRADMIVARHHGYDWTPWLTARMLRRPLVLEVNAPLYLEKDHSGRRALWLLRWMEVAQWRRATRIRAVSRELAEILHGHGIAEDRIVTIPNGADTRSFPEKKQPSAQAPGLRVVFVGGFYKWHGVALLVEAFGYARRRVSALELLLIGHGPEFTTVEQQVHELGLQKIVLMPGRLSPSAITECLVNSDIAAAPYPSLEPFYFSPLKVYEYMAAGLPVVASNQGQLGDLIEDGRTGILVPPGDVRAFSDGMAHLAINPSLRLEMGAAARAVIAQRYTWAHAARRLHTLCSDAVQAYTGLRHSSEEYKRPWGLERI